MIALQLSTEHVFLMRQAILMERKIASMTDDPLYPNWVFEKSFRVITNNDINSLLAICGPKAFEKVSSEIICPHHGHWVVAVSI